jgi:branched-subunit amino acid transport protein
VTVWWTIGGLAVATAAIKGLGPALFGGRTPSARFVRVIALMAPALLAALVVTNVLADGRHLGVGADTAGIAIGGVLIWRGHSLVLAAVVAVVTTAALRAIL